MPARGFSFPYRTSIETLHLAHGRSLQIERLASLDETIDAFFAEYERSGRAELFADHCPYFGVPWPAGVALARLVSRAAQAWRGSTVLELGCGLALPSLALAQAGLQVTATDLHPDVPAFLARNSALNQLEGVVAYRALDWRVGGALPAADLVLGSDVLYDREQPAALLSVLERLPWWEAIFTDPGRPYWESFLALARAHPWQVEEDLVDGIFLVRITR